jgi:hypothetical protein
MDKEMATDKQLATLKHLVKQVEPEMIIPNPCSKNMASVRIKWLIKKRANPNISKKQYMN